MQAVKRLVDDAEELYLDGAEVVDASGPAPRVAVPGHGVVQAELALALPYAPAEGDILLVIGKKGRYFVIGVLAGRGKTTLSLQGDVDVEAVGGTLRLGAGKAVEIRAPEVSLSASRFEAVVGAAVQTFESLWQRVSSLLHVHAGEAHTLVDGASTTQAKSAVIQTQETVTINGKEIHLG